MNPKPAPNNYRERAQMAREAKDSYPVDMGQRQVCEHCGSIYFVKREEVKNERQEPEQCQSSQQ